MLADFLAQNFMGGNLVFSDVKDAGHKGQAASQARASSRPSRHAEGLTKGRSKQAFINVNAQRCKRTTTDHPSLPNVFFSSSKLIGTRLGLYSVLDSAYTQHKLNLVFSYPLYKLST
jgi:hypothetical protein